MEKRWVLKKQGDNKIITDLQQALNIDIHLANLLVQRGIYTFDEAKSFFRPQLSALHDPFLMKDMDIAIQRIETAFQQEQKILVYGDYDVDGCSAVALVYSFLKEIYKNVDFYIPDRYSEGYGISYKGIDFAADNNFKLIIALDCGIKATDQIAYANGKGVDFIIGDHHRPGEILPAAVAVLDPKRLDSTYPYNELSGCGIGFKIVQAYIQKNNIPFQKIEKYLDLVAISIAADIVPITGENRILAYYGLKLINSNPRPGIEAVLRYSNVCKNELYTTENELFFKRGLTINDLVFLISPRINAAGRIETGRSSVELLICKDLEAAMVFGEQINNNNTERKSLDATATQQALEFINKDEFLSKSKSTVIFNPEWHKGVVGIVASRLTEEYYRPTIVLTQSNGLITGSARSVKDFDIYDAIEACSELLEHFGGHKYAAGLSLKPENLDAFRMQFEEVVSSSITVEMQTPEIEIDDCIQLKDINNKFYNILKQFAPFGPGNMSPVFQTDNVKDAGYSRIVGNNHIKLSVISPDVASYPISGIAFQQGEYFSAIQKGFPFSISYHIEENEWNGKTSLQLNVKDIRFE
ncbi:MAG: single-stranded-DNA-specific exonuclease RecJ [Bacteroidetes bacterium]|nr:single-stranded-DNA-specific exonuclease RecJ [Bacteroidota bacterium]